VRWWHLAKRFIDMQRELFVNYHKWLQRSKYIHHWFCKNCESIFELKPFEKYKNMKMSELICPKCGSRSLYKGTLLVNLIIDRRSPVEIGRILQGWKYLGKSLDMELDYENILVLKARNRDYLDLFKKDDTTIEKLMDAPDLSKIWVTDKNVILNLCEAHEKKEISVRAGFYHMAIQSRDYEREFICGIAEVSMDKAPICESRVFEKTIVYMIH